MANKQLHPLSFRKLNRREFLKYSTLGGIDSAFPGLFGLAAPANQPDRPAPNVVMVVIDTLRPDYLSFHGCGQKTAPFLARLAGESVVFTRAFAASSYTSPSDAESAPVDLDQKTVEMFESLGYVR